MSVFYSETPVATPVKEGAIIDGHSDIEASSTEKYTSPQLLLDESDSVNGKVTNVTHGQALLLCLPALVVPFSITVYAPLVDRLKADWGVTTVEYNLNITFALVGLALAPILLNPLLEVVGKKRAIIATWALFIVFEIGAAFVNDLAGLVLLRFFAFLFAGPVVSLSFTAMARLAASRRRHWTLWLASTFTLLSLSMGPVVGGLIEGHAKGMNLNWSRYMVPIMALITIIPYTISGFEEIPPVILSRSIDVASHSTTSAKQVKSQYTTFMKHFITFNTREYIVIGITLYLSQIYFFFYVTLLAFPYAFGYLRGYSTSEVALTFLSLVVGVLLSLVIPIISTRQRKTSHPESGMACLLVCAVLMPIGLFLFAWTAPVPSISVAAPIIGVIIFAFGSNVILTELNVYLADIYESHAAVAFTCPHVSQCLTASIAPLLTLFMIRRVTFGGSLSVLGGVLIGLTTIPFIAWWKGGMLRRRSEFARKN